MTTDQQEVLQAQDGLEIGEHSECSDTPTTNGGDFEVFDADTCQFCESSMMKEPYQ